MMIFHSGVRQTVALAMRSLPTRPLTLSKCCLSQNTFTVQDTKDFNERVKNSKTPVIVDFFATWCNPCRTLTPRIETVINENDGKVLLAKVDIDENSDLAEDYEVMSVPMLMAVQNGKVVDKIVGLQDVDKLRKFVQQVVKEEAS